MNHLTLQSSSELNILSQQLSITQEELKFKLIDKLIEFEAIGGDIQDCGNTIIDISDVSSLKSVIKDVFGGMSYILLLNLSQQIIISTLGDCPMCGCELEHTDQMLNKHTWKDTSCSNCDHTDTGEPDWDIAEGGYSYNS